MAWQPWIDITSDSYMDIAFVSQSYENAAYVNVKIKEYVGSSATLVEPNTLLGTQTQPLPDYLNLVENNLDALITAAGFSVSLLPRRTWLGENQDVEKFKYSDVNRWFSTMTTLKAILDATSAHTPHCGSTISGQGGLML